MSVNVLHLIASNFISGPEKQILYHAQDMDGTEFRIAIGSFRDLPEVPEIIRVAEERGLRTVCISGGIRPGLVTELKRILLDHHIDMLCTHGYKANILGYLATLNSEVKQVAFVRGWTAETRRVALYEWIEKYILRRIEHIVCVSRKQAEQLRAVRSNEADPVVIRNASLPPFTSGGHQDPVSRSSLSIPEGAFVFGALGRLSVEKGHRFLISAFHMLCEKTDRPLFLLFLGEGRERMNLEEQAARLGIGDRVHFAGFQRNCGPWMLQFNCLVQPSLTEGTPNSILEALLLNIPVIATSVGGVPDVIHHNQNGLLVPAGDVKSLVVQMERMVQSPELRQQLVHGGAAICEEFSPAMQRSKLISMYGAVLSTAQAKPALQEA